MGRPAKYTNPDDMQALIHLYFLDCKKNREAEKDDLGEVKDVITPDLHPTVTGLALVLDLTRQGLINYEGKEEFIDTVRKAKTRIEAYNEQGLLQSVNGVIFNLKNNFNWKDKQEIEHSGDMPNNGGICRASEILREFRGSRQGDSVQGDVQD